MKTTTITITERQAEFISALQAGLGTSNVSETLRVCVSQAYTAGVVSGLVEPVEKEIDINE